MNDSSVNNDQSGLLTATEMAEKKRSDASKTLYFEDGERKIDCIVAYEVDPEDDDADKKEQFRQTYFNNLQEKGLVLEKAEQAKPGKEEYGTFEDQKKQETEVHYYKVHAPFDLLCDTAEDIKMKMPVRENDIVIKAMYETAFGIYDTLKKLDPFELRDRSTKPAKNYFVKHFDKDYLKSFIGHEDPDTFFTPAERSRLVYYIMENTKFGSKELDLGVYNLIHRGIIADCYPLHDGNPREDRSQPAINDRQALQADWATPRKIFKYQPIPSIKDYFGEKIALYFAWLGFYTAFLIPASIVGILCFIYGVGSSVTYTPIKELCNPPKNNDTYYQFYMCPLCDKLCSYYLLEKSCLYAKVNHFFDNQATLFFAIFMSIWATLFLEFWKRRQVSLAYEWHTMDFEEEEERPRPEYLAVVTRLKENPVTGKMEPYMPPGQRCQRLSGAFGIVIFFIVLVLAAVVSVIVFRAAFYAFLIGQSNPTIRARSKIVVSACAACINLIAINLLKQIYQRIAVIITNWENPRTRTDYEDSFTVKMFWFQFANTYASIFYVAFFKSEFFTGSPGKYKRFGERQFRFEGCSVQGCFLELTVQLIIIMVGQQIIGNIVEIVLPFIKNKIRDYKNRNQNLYTTTDEPQWVTDYEGEMQTKFSLFWQYLEIVLQYGFVTMFVAAFPLAPLFAWFNNMIEIRLDAVNFIHNFRRPFAERAEDIGAWYGILATLTTFSTLVNSFVLAYTSELIPHLVYKYYVKDDGSLEGFTEWSLSYFPVTSFTNSSTPDNPTMNVPRTQNFCRYPGYHDRTSPFNRNINYWVITAARLAFILCFQALVISITWAVGYVIPDIPKSLQLKIKRENFIASEMDKDHKEKAGKRKPRPEQDRKIASSEPVDATSLNQQYTTYI